MTDSPNPERGGGQGLKKGDRDSEMQREKRERTGKTNREHGQGTEQTSKIIPQDVSRCLGGEMVLVVKQVRWKAQGTVGPRKVVFCRGVCAFDTLL